MELKKTANSQSNVKMKTGNIMLPEFKIYYKVIVLKTVWYWGRGERHKDQQNRTDSPEINPHVYD